ncbi:hypothetical protein [Ramlibacter albus]|uniref:Metal-dependent hydrolase n=1 Tax=Ramlibacter albus TaxID=2079448 RepID=A0A923MCM9_9BURK|nr:hypothetical protein [Ramlibacter albus]MBC5767096.1 hypothetical protein [Ramlibacter albus]
MFLGHFAVAYAAKPLAARISLGTAFLCAQFLDLLWPTLLLAGVETVRIAPAGSTVPLVFESYPYSHSLVAALFWAALVALVHFAFRRSKVGALVVGALVVSHWLLDLVVHVPDLPLVPGGDVKWGFGLWQWKGAALAVELALFGCGVYLYTRATRPLDGTGRWAHVALVAFLAVIQFANVFGPPPPGVSPIAWVGQAQWLLVAWAYWVDSRRRPVAAAPACPGAPTLTPAGYPPPAPHAPTPSPRRAP